MGNGRRRVVIEAAAFLIMVTIVAATNPVTAAAAGPHPDHSDGQVVGLYFDDAVDGSRPGPGSPAGSVSSKNTVWGTCGWASMDVVNRGAGIAEFRADAGLSIPDIIVRADWTIGWQNFNSGGSGSFGSSTTQFSPTSGVRPQWITGAGWVQGTLTYLKVTLLSGRTCTGLQPWDTEVIT